LENCKASVTQNYINIEIYVQKFVNCIQKYDTTKKYRICTKYWED